MDPEYSQNFLRITKAAAADYSSAIGDIQTPQSVLHAAFDAIIRGDFEAFGQCVAEDIELHISGFQPSGLGELDGAWRGRDQVVAATRKNFALLDEQKPELENMISQGDRIAVLLRESGVFKSNGRGYNVRGVQWFTFAGGKIKRIDEIIASAAAVPQRT
jgi:ketosteroid isomerase-like protein